MQGKYLDIKLFSSSASEKTFKERIPTLQDEILDFFLNQYWEKDITTVIGNNNNIEDYYLTTPVINHTRSRHGQFLHINTNGILNKDIFVYFPSSKTVSQGRNTFITQNFFPAYKEYLSEKEKNPNCEFICYMRDSQNATESILFSLRCLATIGIKIVNWENKQRQILPFTAADDLINAKNALTSHNKGNNSTHLERIKNSLDLIIYAKSDGANQSDSVLMAAALQKIANDQKFNISLRPYIENKKTSKFSSESTTYLSLLGVKIDEEYKTYNKKEEERVNQKRFRKNLTQKFKSENCLCCDKSLGPKASHIHRQVDIQNDHTLNNTQKKEERESGENGIWLCPQHDYYFENCLISFNQDGKIVYNKELLSVSELKEIKQTFINEQIPEKYLTPKMKANLNKHQIRTREKIALTQRKQLLSNINPSKKGLKLK